MEAGGRQAARAGVARRRRSKGEPVVGLVGGSSLPVLAESLGELLLASGSQAPHPLFLRSQMSFPHPPLNKNHVLWKINLIYDSYQACLCGVGRECSGLRRGRGVCVHWVSTGPCCSDPQSPLVFRSTSFPSCGHGEGDVRALDKQF